MSAFRITRFTATMIVIAIVASGVGVVLFLDLYRSQQESRGSYAEAVRGLDLIGDLQYDAQEARRTLLYALVTTDSNLQVDYADQSRAADAEVARHIVAYRQLANDTREIAAAEKLSADWSAYLAVRDKLIASMLEGDPKAAVARDLRDGVPAFNAMRVDLENTKQHFKTNADQLLRDVDVSFQRSLRRLALILGMLAVLGGVSVKMAQGGTLLRELRASEARLRADFEKARAEERASAELFAAVLRAATEYSIIGTTPSGIVTVFNEGAERMLGYEADEIVGKLTPAVIHLPAEVAARAVELGIEPGFEVFAAAARRGEAETREWTYVRKDGTHFPVSLTVTAMRDGDGALAGFIGIATDIGARQRSDAELKELHARLLDASRQAGMAEVATGVLHNVGNVLNSVNVSGNLLSERLKGSKVADLAKIAALLGGHEADFVEFVANDPRGKRIPALVSRATEALQAERATLLAEVDVITSHIGHIKEIVAMQQNFAKVGGLFEPMEVEALVGDALKMNAVSLTRHKVSVVKEYEAVPRVLVDKHKVLQILVNLLRNAKQAVDESGREDKRVTVKIQNNGGEFVKIGIQDNGMGIAPENLDRIFAHGYTTKKTGHGFGLHSGALAATEMGGTLSVHSDGPGTGATFTLKLPVAARTSAATAG